MGGVMPSGARAEDWPLIGFQDRDLKLVREGMYAVVNEAGGTAGIAKLPAALGQMAGKTGSSQVRRVTREQREKGFDSQNLPWELRPHALFVAYAPYDAPRYALAVVVEHGNAGSAAAAPIARDIMIDTLTRDPAGRDRSPGQRVAEGR
jgi:penicillin-binding protein 2